jgi:ABC-type uncharacterized transport system ATPase subunit
MTQETEAANKSERQPYLHIERLTKMFESFAALKDVSLDVYEGEFVCFLGPSGCGKTTRLAATSPPCPRRSAISASYSSPTPCSRTSR